MSFLSSYLTADGRLKNFTWNDSLPFESLLRMGDEESEDMLWKWDDATWILAASFIIFTMQTGKKSLDH